MNNTELKTYLHAKIEASNDVNLFTILADVVELKTEGKAGSLWSSLTKEQQNEVLTAYEESENESELLSIQEFFGS